MNRKLPIASCKQQRIKAAGILIYSLSFQIRKESHILHNPGNDVPEPLNFFGWNCFDEPGFTLVPDLVDLTADHLPLWSKAKCNRPAVGCIGIPVEVTVHHQFIDNPTDPRE